MELFLDVKFNELFSSYTDIFSLALISNSDRVFYAEFNDYEMMFSNWVLENVISNLVFYNETEYLYRTPRGSVYMKNDTDTIVKMLKDWLKQFYKAIVIVDVGAWDWVKFCQLFRGVFNLPSNISHIPFELSTMLEMVGQDPDLDREKFAPRTQNLEVISDRFRKHNALWDAIVSRAVYRRFR